jgi:hypothetical protein
MGTIAIATHAQIGLMQAAEDLAAVVAKVLSDDHIAASRATVAR